jgi:uncharacterized membrane protein
MKLRLERARGYLRTSLWFIPSVFVAIGFLTAEGALRIDRQIDREGGWFLFGGGIESARAVVTTIATSMLTFTGLVFSVTMLVLQLASNQLSPRVMRTFLRDRANQAVLGVFVATFVYALLVLRRITQVADGEPFVPALSVWLAMVFVLISIGLFVYYIHHMAQSIRPVSVMAHVAEETRSAIRRLYPDGVGQALPEALAVPEGNATAIVLSPGPNGVLTGIDEERILAAATKHGCVIVLEHMPGDFVRDGARLFTIYGRWDREAEGDLVASVAFGLERTMQQDAAFGLRQLVDIAQRALSPGINDPTTAVQVIDQLHALLGEIVVRDIPSPNRKVDGALAVVLPRPSWETYVALACDEIRRAGSAQIQIQRRLRAMLNDLLEVAHESRRPPLEEQLRLLDAALEREFAGAERERAGAASSQGS